MQNQQQQMQPEKTQYIKECIICECQESPLKKMIKLFSDKEHICLDCYTEQNSMIVDFKKNKPKLYPDYHLIIQNLYLGNQDSAIDDSVIKENSISAICVCGSFLLTPHQQKQLQGTFSKMLYWKLDIADFPTQQILSLLDETTDWINKQLNDGRKVLVHCAAGASRSASFTIAYLMKYREFSYIEAHKFVKERRNIISLALQNNFKNMRRFLKVESENLNQQQISFDDQSDKYSEIRFIF